MGQIRTAQPPIKQDANVEGGGRPSSRGIIEWNRQEVGIEVSSPLVNPALTIETLVRHVGQAG